MRVPVAGALLTLAPLAACRELVRPPEGSARCQLTTTVALTVSPGTTPTFGWSPACRLDRVAVWEEGGNAQRMWEIVDSVPSGLRYGDVPAGSREITAAKPLAPGVRYRVSASNVEAFGGAASGQASFTP